MSRSSTTTEQAYAYAKARILDGRFDGGTLLSEGEVARGVGVSRTPVREAFLRLESEGLLRLYPKRGALVVPVSAAEVKDVMETRLLVERFAIERIGRASAMLSAELESSIGKQEGLIARGDLRRFVDADREFHRTFVAATGNEILLSLHDSLRDRQRRMGLAALSKDAERVKTIIAEHRELAAAIVAGDASATEILDVHLAGTFALLSAGGSSPA